MDHPQQCLIPTWENPDLALRNLSRFGEIHALKVNNRIGKAQEREKGVEVSRLKGPQTFAFDLANHEKEIENERGNQF